MAEAEPVYMDEGFDLPRWQTHIDPLSSSAQAAHAAQASYYAQNPGQNNNTYNSPGTNTSASPQRMPQPPTARQDRVQPRISQLMDQDHHSPYLSTGPNQLARSASLGGGTTSSSSSRRRHHQPDDLEGAFNAENRSYYPPTIAYQPPSNSVTSPTSPSADSAPYSDMYYSTHPPPPKRSSHETAAAASRSPLRGPNTPNSAALLEPFSQQQSQYSPTTTTYSSFNGPPDQRSYNNNSHSRTHSVVKPESLTPPIPSPYSPPGGAGAYPPPYAMDTSSPHPQLQPPPNNRPPLSVSNPPTPLSYLSASPGYYDQQQQMVVDIPQQQQQKRSRASGFRRLRAPHDLQPRLDIPPVGRRMGSDGTFLSVS